MACLQREDCESADAIVSWTAALYVVVFAIIGLTQVNPLAPILVSSVAFVTNLLPFMASIPVLVGDDSKLGSALGVFNALVSLGMVSADRSEISAPVFFQANH